MVIEVPVKGYFAENCFFYIDDHTKHGFVIDPGAQAEGLLELIGRNGWVIEKILLTHGHFDHIGAVNVIRSALRIPVFAHENADMYLLDTRMNLSAACGESVIVRDANRLQDGEEVCLTVDPAFRLKVFYTPGHTPDSVVYYAEKDRVAFVGDTIFKGSIGNWRYPGGNLRDLNQSISEKIFTLPDNTVLCSGHTEKTTIGAEKRRYAYR